ncbi:MAG TPA: sulfotransferase [Baekduia sp.]|nr:sulfotransferase [Baekduia sp.]
MPEHDEDHIDAQRDGGATPERRGPIFIIGAMGSGTTLLRLMLDSHEHIAIPHETGFMRAYNAMRFIPFKWTGRGWTQRLGWSPEELDAELRALFDRLFMRYATEHGKQRWGEKTPLHTWHISNMHRLFPDAQFIGIVRHPGASISSNMRRFKHTAGWMARHYDRYTRELTRQALRLPDHMRVLRYEDLLLQTEPVMRELLEWLGEPWSDRVLEHHVVQGERGSTRVEGKSRADDPLDVSRMDRWTQTIDPADRRTIARRVGRLAAFYGYSMDDGAQIAPLTTDGGTLLTAATLEARAAEFADLDLHAKTEPPSFEQLYSPRKFWLVRNKTGEPPAFGRAAEAKARAEAAAQAKAAAAAAAAQTPAWRRAVAPVARQLPPATRRRLRAAASRLAGRRG